MKKNLGKTLSLPVGYGQPSALERIMADRDRGITQEQSQYHTAQNTHNSSWQNSQTFISLLGAKELEIRSYEEKYKTLREDQKKEFVNLTKQITLDSLKTQLNSNYFEPDVYRSFKASIERLESIIDGWATGVIQPPKQANPNYLKLDQYTSQQPSAKEFVEKYNNSIDFIEKQRESLDQLPHDKKLEVIAQIKSKITYSLQQHQQELRTGIYSPNARHEYEQAIIKLVSIINDLELLSVMVEQPNQNIPNQNNQQLILPNNQEDEEQNMINELRAQLEQLRLQMEQRDNTIEQQANDLIAKDNIIDARNTTIEQQANDLIAKDNIIDARNTTIEQQANDLITKDNIIGERNNTILELQTKNHDLTGRLAISEENNGILQNENHNLTDRLIVSEENNGTLKNENNGLKEANLELTNKLVISGEKIVEFKEKVLDLQSQNKELKDDKIELRKDKEMLAEYNKNLQKEKELSLVDKKHYQDLSSEQALKITELSQIHCNDPEHFEMIKLSGLGMNAQANDSD